jgi:hypothetical protein
MDYLREYAEELGLRQILGAFTERRDVQGAVLVLDDWWLTAWRLSETGRLREWELWCREWMHFMPRPFPPFFMLPDRDRAQDAAPWVPTRRPDLSWRPRFWSDYAHYCGRPTDDLPPIRLIICVRPPEENEKPAGFDFPETGLPISVEVRPVARLANAHRTVVRPVVGGVSVGVASEYGTLGGIVEDGTGTRFGTTCAHVFPAVTPVDQPWQRDDANATSIGTSTPVVPLHACTSPTPCDPYSNDPHIAETDSALVTLDPGIAADLEVLAVGPLAGVVSRRSIMPGQSIEFAGRTSGLRNAEVGGLVLFYRLQLGGKVYCFRNLFEVRWKAFLRTLFGPVVQAGDSGAWVCAATARGSGWCGQVIGEDRHVGYATFAETTVAAWANAGKHLRVV